MMIDVFREKDDIHAILSLGPNTAKFEKDLPSNVEVFSFVPQLEVLSSFFYTQDNFYSLYL